MNTGNFDDAVRTEPKEMPDVETVEEITTDMDTKEEDSDIDEDGDKEPDSEIEELI